MDKRVLRGLAIVAVSAAGLVQINNINLVSAESSKFSATLLDSTTVTIPQEPIDLAIRPSSSGTFGSTNFNVIVATNQPGYTLTMTTSSTALTSSTVNPSTNERFTIPTLDYVSGGYTQSNFTVNRWGISIDGGNYNAITASQQLKDTDTATNADTTTIGVGANLNLLTPSGTYETTVNFAVVTKVIIRSIDELTNLQDFSGMSSANMTNVKNSMTTGSAFILTDSRDGTSYHIAKLADGNIWMLDNLALDIADTTILNNLDPTNTNANAASLTSLRSGNRAAGDQYATAGISSSWNDSYSTPRFNITGKDYVPDNAPTNGLGYNKVGGFYNYCAVSAGSYCYGEDFSSSGEPSTDATEDICPAGWRLPTGGSSGEYQTLYALYSSNYNTFRTALSLPLPGDYYHDTNYVNGREGYYWTNTFSNVNNMDLAYLSTSAFSMGATNRPYGFSVRCIAK